MKEPKDMLACTKLKVLFACVLVVRNANCLGCALSSFFFTISEEVAAAAASSSSSTTGRVGVLVCRRRATWPWPWQQQTFNNIYPTPSPIVGVHAKAFPVMQIEWNINGQSSHKTLTHLLHAQVPRDAAATLQSSPRLLLAQNAIERTTSSR